MSAPRRPAPPRSSSTDVTIRYAGSPRPALRSASFALEEGELVVVTGRTGLGQVDPARGGQRHASPTSPAATCPGRVLGLRPRHPRPTGRATSPGVVGVVRQDPLAGFVTDTVEEELAYTLEQLALDPAAMRRRVEEVLDLLGHRRPARRAAARPVGRPAAAGRHRLRAHRQPAPARARRTHLGPRPDRRRGGARDAVAAGPRPRPDRRAVRAPARADRRRGRPGHRGARRRHGQRRPTARRHGDRGPRATGGPPRPLGRLGPAAPDDPRRPARGHCAAGRPLARPGRRAAGRRSVAASRSRDPRRT